MPFQKGNQLGNRKGRPRKGDSMAEAIRSRFNLSKRNIAIDALAKKAAQGDTQAFDVLAKRGWPDEAKGDLQINLPEATSVQVIHKHVSA